MKRRTSARSGSVRQPHAARYLRLQAGVYGFGLEGEYCEDTFVDAPEGLAVGEAVEGFQAEGVLAQGERALVAEGAFAEPVQVGRFGVVGAVDDPEVVAAADLEAGLGESVLAAGEVGGGLDDHALAAGPGELFPPGGGRGGAGGVGGVHDGAPGGRE